MSVRNTLSSAWQRRGPLAWLLLPLAALFALLAALRRGLYRLGILQTVHLPVPVIVIGNITAGGSGKTPLVLHLAQQLARCGRHPGIVSRGYGGTVRGVQAVQKNSGAMEVGDEPLLLARRAGCPVFIGRDRVAAAEALLAAHPECDVIISDDGLQHYRLAREIEIAVVDKRGVGNGWLLPAGPLRESGRRLATVDAVVMNGSGEAPSAASRKLFRMTLRGERFFQLGDPERSCGATELQDKPLHAMAGIGNPSRFFRHLESLGLRFIPHVFPDHHAYQAADLRFVGADTLLMTEKDAVKCSAFAPAESWVLPVDAQLDADLAHWILEQLHQSRR